MNQADFLAQATVYLGAALVTVPLASRLGLGSVLGYLGAGLIIGPWGLGFVGDEGEEVQHFAEFGVVMMLFLVGLELQPSRLWRLRGPILGLGGLQVLLSAFVMGVGALALGRPWKESVALGLILAMSSTAIALQSIQERGLGRAESGQNAFAVLLFQDIAVIPILALLPALATYAPAGGDGHHGGSFADGLHPAAYALLVFGAVAAVVLGGRFLGRPLFRLVARTRLREMFTASALLLVVGVAQLMTLVGLSAALGTFLAGVVLAESEYRHELESDIEPFKGLLLGVFFIAVGSTIDLGVLLASPGLVLGLLAAVMGVKATVLLGLGWGFGGRADQRALFAAALAGVGEFAFVLLGFAQREGVVEAALVSPLLVVTALSMAATPLLLLAVERGVLPRLAAAPAPAARDSDVEDHGNPVIIAGYGRFGQIAGRYLTACGVRTTTVDIDSDQIDMLRRFGQRVYYGDASRLDLLTAAGAARARVLIVAVDDHQKALDIAHLAHRHFPGLAVLSRARGRAEAYDLLDAEVDAVYRETFETALKVGVDALRLLGVSSHRALRQAQTFRRFDEEGLRDMAKVRHDQERLVRTARERIALLERTLSEDQRHADALDEAGWDSEVLREAARVQPPRG